MAVTCSGILRDPSGNILPNLRIILRAIGTNAFAIDGSVSEHTTGADGSYSFVIQQGLYGCYVDYGYEQFLGELFIGPDTEDAELNTYLLSIDLGSAVIQAGIEFQNFVDQATGQANRARDEADDAEQDRIAAQAAQTAAEAARDTTLAALPSEVGALNAITQAAVEARRAINRERFAGSGWEHFGKVVSSSSWEPVNEGLWCRTESNTDTSVTNSFFIGRSAAPASGNSKTDEGVIQIAGFTVHLDSLNISATGQAQVKLSESPTGAVTYDSATGTVFDFETQEDPKYSNIAADRNEAVARAFEGIVFNGDFRNGIENWAAFQSATVTATNGILTVNQTGATGLGFQTIPLSSIPANTEIIVEVTLEPLGNAIGAADLQILHSPSNFVSIARNIGAGLQTFTHRYTTPADATTNQIEFRPAAQDGQINVHSISIRPVTNQVVTRRVDMWGFEGFLEEVTESNPFVYPNGLIQSQATTMNGINTVTGTRPASYYAVFDGDTTSVGRGVNFFTATDAQKEAMLGDPKNNLYRLEDGRLVQFRVRQRTINGAGNGNWDNIFVNNQGSSFDQFLTFFRSGEAVRPHGIQDSTVSLTRASGDSFATLPLQRSNLDQTDLGAFAAWSSPTRFAVNGECYFLVGGTVSRLNQGAYHPELNSFGTTTFWHLDNTTAGSFNWSHANAKTPLTVRDCFIGGTSNSASNFIRTNQGNIASAISGRTNDNRMYDAIYADGLGGVVDYRWSANDRSDPKWGAKAKLEVEAGTYRGLELVERTTVFDASPINSDGTGQTLNITGIGLGANVGDKLFFIISGSIVESQIQSVANDNQIVSVLAVNRNNVSYIVRTSKLDVSVSGNFTRTDTIADPVRLLATFPTGIEGGWISQIPDNTSPFSLTRKRVGSSTGVNLSAITTLNNGDTWGSANRAFNEPMNQQTTVLPSDRVQVTTYTAFAKQTERSTNTEVLNEQVGQYGVNAVSYFGTTTGALLAESLIGRVLVSDSTGRGLNQNYPYTLLNLRADNGLIDATSGRESEHSPLQLPAPTNDGRGVKYAAHQVNDNGQATLNFIFNELDHDGTDWGDDSRLRVLNGTYTNQNGVSGLQANVDRLRIPYGIIKNEV